MPSLLEALEQKYGEIGSNTAGSTPAIITDHIETTSSSSSSPDKDSAGISVAIFVPCRPARAAVPALLVLNDCDIATAGERDALIAKCSNVEELDLAKNKLDRWTEVFRILEQMPRLKFVNLSFNILSNPLEITLDKTHRWEELRSLVLNSTYVNWPSVKEILDHLPSLEELHLSLNDFNNVDLHNANTTTADNNNSSNNNSNNNNNNTKQINNDEQQCKCTTNETNNKNCNCQNYKFKHKHQVIRILHFTGNPVQEWNEICKLGYAFPNLESLVLADCPIKSLEYTDQCKICSQTTQENNDDDDDDDDKENIKKKTAHDAFKSLKILNLNSTNLSTWDDIEKLSKFPSLQCVRVQGCPLWESNEYTEHERRQLLIARLPNVQTLNGGGQITAEEREDAERAFIRYYMDKPESDRPERYTELIQIHGKLDPLVNIDLRPEKRVKVTFTCGSNSEIRSVDVYRTVSDLKQKLECFAGFTASKMRLFYVDQDLRDIQGPEEMRYPSKQLYSYNIRSGDEILIICKIECKRRTASESKASEKDEKSMYNL